MGLLKFRAARMLLSFLVVGTAFLSIVSGKSSYHIGYRKVNWCVTGKDEPELHSWPFSQFVPFLRRTNRLKLDNDIRYDLRLFDITTTQKDVGLNGRLYKTMHVVFKAEKKRDPKTTAKIIWEPLPLEGLIIQANSNPFTLGLPTGQFFPPGTFHDPKTPTEKLPPEKHEQEIHCTDCDHKTWARSIMCRKRAKIHMEHPTILAWHHMQPSFNDSGGGSKFGGYSAPAGEDNSGPSAPAAPGQSQLPPAPPPIYSDGKQSEVHANYRFYSPRCAPTRRMMFTILAVRSFANQEYDIFYRGPYEVTIRDQRYQSDYHPSPYFYYYTHQAICHHHSASDLTLEHPQRFQDFEMNHFFDCCIREEENWKTKVTVELLNLKHKKTTSCEDCLYKAKAIKCDNEKFKTIKVGEESYMCFFPYLPKTCQEDDKDFETAMRHYDPCPPCKTPPTTTTEKVTKKPESIYKRTVHGGLMIMTNFCLQPIVIYIARFYKETFNTKSYKGAKSWYWMHLLGGMVSSTMVYFGYFSGGVSDKPGVVAHVVIGKVYIITLAVCYGTAWGRHKNTIITTVAEFMHGCFGYVTISLAIASVESAPGLGFTSKLLVYMMVATQGFFMIILTCHICLLDKKFGMRPKRRHFPTVEARFDEIAVPKIKFRVILLIIFSSITFSLSTASTFFD